MNAMLLMEDNVCEISGTFSKFMIFTPHSSGVKDDAPNESSIMTTCDELNFAVTASNCILFLICQKG